VASTRGTRYPNAPKDRGSRFPEDAVMRRLHKRQEGLSATGYIILIALVGFVLAIALKLIPIYIEHYYVVHSLESLVEEAETIPDDEIRSRLLKNFSINDVDDVDRHDIKLTRLSSGALEVSVAYDVQRQLVGNVDVLIHFSNSVELKKK
jgi:hypothetical protein